MTPLADGVRMSMLSLTHPSRIPTSVAPPAHARLVLAAPAIDVPRVLAVLNMGTGWSRGVLRGFVAAAHERRWTVLHYPPPVDLEALVQKFAPSAILVGPD